MQFVLAVLKLCQVMVMVMAIRGVIEDVIEDVIEEVSEGMIEDSSVCISMGNSTGLQT